MKAKKIHKYLGSLSAFYSSWQPSLGSSSTTETYYRA